MLPQVAPRRGRHRRKPLGLRHHTKKRQRVDAGRDVRGSLETETPRLRATHVTRACTCVVHWCVSCMWRVCSLCYALLRDAARCFASLTIHSFIPFHSIPFHSIPFHSISFHFISFHFISFHFISFHFISFHFISFHFISFHFISFHFISFHFISFHFISFHFISFHFISFHFISFHFISFHFISFHFISFHFISFHFISFHFISFHFISFHFISFHFISFHFISFHFISFHFISFHFISFIHSFIHSFIQQLHSTHARHAHARVKRESHHTVAHKSVFSQVVQRTLSPPFALREPPRLSSFLRYVVSYGTRCSVFLLCLDELTEVGCSTSRVSSSFSTCFSLSLYFYNIGARPCSDTARIQRSLSVVLCSWGVFIADTYHLLCRSIGTHCSRKTLSLTLSCFRIIRRMRLPFENHLKILSALFRQRGAMSLVGSCASSTVDTVHASVFGGSRLLEIPYSSQCLVREWIHVRFTCDFGVPDTRGFLAFSGVQHDRSLQQHDCVRWFASCCPVGTLAGSEATRFLSEPGAGAACFVQVLEENQGLQDRCLPLPMSARRESEKLHLHAHSSSSKFLLCQG